MVVQEVFENAFVAELPCIEGIEQLEEHEQREYCGAFVTCLYAEEVEFGLEHDYERHEQSVDDYAQQHILCEYACVPGRGFAVHKTCAHGFKTERDCGRTVHYDIYPQHLQCREGVAYLQNHAEEDYQHGRKVYRKLELNEALEVFVNASAPLHRGDYRGERVVQKDDIAGLLGNFRTRNAHCDADVGVLYGGSVVYAVARYRNHVALRLERLDHSHLYYGGGAGYHADFGNYFGELLVVEVLYVLCLHRYVLVVEYAELGGYGLGGYNVVAREHLYVYARVTAVFNGVEHVGAERVGYDDEPVERHSAFNEGALGGEIVSPFQGAVGKADYSARLSLVTRDCLLGRFALFGGHFAHCENLFGTALGIGDCGAVLFDYRSHILGFGGERVAVNLSVRTPHAEVVNARLVRRNEHSALGRVADKFGLVALEVHVCRGVYTEVLHKSAVRGHFRGGEMSVAHLHVGDGHSVFGERTRLIRTYDVYAADSFAGDQLFDQRVLFGHLYYIYGERNRNYRGKTLGHGGHYEHYAVDKRIGEQTEYLRCVEAGKASHADFYHLNHKYYCRGYGADGGYKFAELCKLFLKRRAGLVLRGKFAGNFAEFGIVAHSRDYSLAAAARDKAAGIQHVAPFGNGRVFRIADKICLLMHGHALAREGALVRHELRALYKSAVRGQLCARIHAQNVADYDILLRNELHFAVSYYLDQRILAYP